MVFFPVSKEEHYYIKLTLFSDFRGLKKPIYLTRTVLFFEKVVILTVQKQTEISGFRQSFPDQYRHIILQQATFTLTQIYVFTFLLSFLPIQSCT
jgi:hypothetical protein